MSCFVCNLKVSRDELKIKCVQCILMAHAPCVNMSGNDIENLKKEKKSWVCKTCSDTKKNCVKPSAVSTADECDFNDIPGSFKFIYTKLSECSSSLNSKFDEILHLFDSLQKENMKLKSKIVQLEIKVDYLEQITKNKSLDIIGLPVLHNNDDVINTTLQLFSCGLNVAVNDTDIVSIVQYKNSGKIVVEFRSAATRNAVLQAKRKIKNLSSKCINLNVDNIIFINECLTKIKYDLFKRAKEIKKSKHYKYLWLRNGNIMLRKCEGEEVKIINNLSDLAAL